jgi:hypothetical protein
MWRSRPGLVALFYGSFALEILAAGAGIIARELPLAARLAPMAVAYALMVLAYLLWRRDTRPADEPEMWVRIALRLLEEPADDLPVRGDGAA